MIKSLWASVQGDPIFMRKVNGWLTMIWLLAALPICLFLANSVPFLVFISVYAVVTGHLSSWQAARTEVAQNEEAKRHEDEDVAQDVVDKITEQTEVTKLNN